MTRWWRGSELPGPKKAIERLTIHAVDRIEEAIEVVRGV
jgi:hypothetical protein